MESAGTPIASAGAHPSQLPPISSVGGVEVSEVWLETRWGDAAGGRPWPPGGHPPAVRLARQPQRRAPVAASSLRPCNLRSEQAVSLLSSLCLGQTSAPAALRNPSPLAISSKARQHHALCYRTSLFLSTGHSQRCRIKRMRRLRSFPHPPPSMAAATSLLLALDATTFRRNARSVRVCGAWRRSQERDTRRVAAEYGGKMERLHGEKTCWAALDNATKPNTGRTAFIRRAPGRPGHRGTPICRRVHSGRPISHHVPDTSCSGWHRTYHSPSTRA